MLCNFIEIALRDGFSLVNLLYIFRTTFPKNSSEGCFCRVLLKPSTTDPPTHRPLSPYPLCIPFSGRHSFYWKPWYGVRHSAYWNNRTINLLIVYIWPLSAIIKGVFLKIFVYEHEHEKWRTSSINSNW